MTLTGMGVPDVGSALIREHRARRIAPGPARDVPRAWLDRDSSEAGSVARRFRVVGPVVGIVLTARVRRVLVATGSTLQFLGERPEVRLVSAVLQGACYFGLLGLRSEERR